MRSRINRCLVACALLVTLIPTPAAADPITDLTPLMVGDGFILHGGYTLTLEDLAVLSGRDDNGWHLGWFKKKLRDSGGDFQGDTVDPIWTHPIWAPGVGNGADVTIPPGLPPWLVVPGASKPWDVPGVGAGSALTNETAAPLVTPEPGSLILLGTGLLVVARKLRRRGAGRSAPQN